MMTTDTSWTSADNQRLEESLAFFGDSSSKVQMIAEFMGKDKNLVLVHYNALHHDVELIESGLLKVDYPDYSSPPPPPLTVKTGEVSGNPIKKGKSWTVEEHRAFLWGMETLGKGDWKRIARDFVRTRTPTQVASHSQKYFLRQNDSTVKKRSSIHDITSVRTSSLSTIPRSDSDSLSQPPHNHQLPPRHPHSR